MIFNSRYVCVQQHDEKDCGVACIATICGQYGLQFPISKIRELAGTDQKGTSALGLVRAAEALGFNVRAVQAEPESLFEEFPLPAIAHVVIDEMLLHYVVIHKINREEIVIADPAKGIVTYTPDQFYKIWTGVLILMVPNEEFQTGDQRQSLLSRFGSLLKTQRKLLLHIFFASMLYTVLGIVGAFYFQFLLDEILPYQLADSLHIMAIGVILLHVFSVSLNLFRNHLILYVSQKLDIQLILGYYHHVLRLPMNFFETRKVGEVVSRLMDASKVREALSGATITIMIDTVMVLFGGLILYFENPYLFGVTAMLIPCYAVIVLGFRQPFERTNRKQMEENAVFNSYIIESFHGIETVKANNAEEKALFETEKRFVKLLRTYFRLGFLDNLQDSMKGFLQLVGGVVILWVGGYQVIQGEMTIGQLITFNALLAYFVGPLQNLIDLQPQIQTAVVAARRLMEIFDLELEKERDGARKVVPSKIKGEIQVCNVNFRYGSREKVLEDLSLHIPAGSKVALVGESGSGKTTLIKLLMNFYQPETGDIMVDGYNIQDIDRFALRDRIAYVSQNSFFFSGSILENLELGMKGRVDFEQVVEACRLANADSFIHELPLRYNTPLEENGSNLSGGQRQRLAIARALLKQPDLLLLDEATSNLDSTTEKAISEMLERHCQGITTVIIAHRLSTIRRCDIIYVMEKGRIIESGSHHELLKLGGKYYELWKDQLYEAEPSEGEVVGEVMV
jgi:ABC-type bacteriocin transporter